MRMPVRSKHTHFFILLRFFNNCFVKIVFDNHKIEYRAKHSHNAKLTKGNTSALCKKAYKFKLAFNKEILNFPPDDNAVPNCRL